VCGSILNPALARSSILIGRKSSGASTDCAPKACRMLAQSQVRLSVNLHPWLGSVASPSASGGGGNLLPSVFCCAARATPYMPLIPSQDVSSLPRDILPVNLVAGRGGDCRNVLTLPGSDRRAHDCGLLVSNYLHHGPRSMPMCRPGVLK
jgi:hypothetical protein